MLNWKTGEDQMPWYDAVGKIKLPGGTVGKVCFMVCVVSISFAAIAVAVRSDVVAIVAMVLVATVALTLGLGVIRFADNHPQAALMEGAEFLKHEQQQVQRSRTTPARVVTTAEKADKAPLLPASPADADAEPREEDDRG
jgi:hypothetical protein